MAESTQTTSPQEPPLIRPRAIKATQTVAFCVTHEFHNECIDAGIPESAAVHAAKEAAEWHRRWVLQEEEGHTMPCDADQWIFAIDNMRRGAQNPSLSDGSCSVGSSSFRVPVPQGPMILRPVALRPRDVAHSVENTPPHILSSGLESPGSPLTLPSDAYSPMLMDDVFFHGFSDSVPVVIHQVPPSPLEIAKEELLQSLAVTGGDVETVAFAKALQPLARHYAETGWDACDSEGICSNFDGTRRIEGLWMTLTKASYFGCLGETPEGDPMYTLGRMSFDMFRPTQLVCSLQGNFNPVKVVSPDERLALMERCPKSLRDEIASESSILRRYDIVTAFTIEPNLADFPDAPNKTVRRPIKGIMTTYGYVIPDPTVPNRLSIFFTGGRVQPNDDATDQKEWARLFRSGPLPDRNLGEKLRLLAASLLMGAQPPSELNEDNSIDFEFTRPLGGHGVAYVDVIYLDECLRIVRGHRGTVFVFVRVPEI